jgi:hypothetical protein
MRLLILIFVLLITLLGCAVSESKAVCSSEGECLQKARDTCSLLSSASLRDGCTADAYRNFMNAKKENEKGIFERWADDIRKSRRQEELKAQEAQRQETIKRQQDAIALQNNIQNQCRGYGFQLGTTAMANCVMQIDLAHNQLQKQQQQADAAYNQKLQQCRSMWGQGLGQPTMSGSFGESLGNANTAYRNCMAGMPAAPTQVICHKSPNPQVDYVYCTTR